MDFNRVECGAQTFLEQNDDSSHTFDLDTYSVFMDVYSVFDA